MKRLISIFVIFFLLLSACTSRGSGHVGKVDSQSSSRIVQSMDTVMKLTAYGADREKALDECENEILRLNDLLSTGLETSEVSQLNISGEATVSDDTAFLIKEALKLFESTDGAFDISVYPLTQLWGFPTKEYRVPSPAEIEQVLQSVNAGMISFDSDSQYVTLRPGQSIDLGGIAKGYTSQRLMEIMAGCGVRSAMVSLGGNVQCLGTKPDGSAWKIGIQDPWKLDSGVYAIVQVVDQAVITSGGYERYFEDPDTGKIYRHILNTKTGYPAESGLASVSIVTKNGTMADGLSTALYVMGLEKASEYWRQYSDEFEMILIDDDGSLFISEGLARTATSSHKINIIHK